MKNISIPIKETRIHFIIKKKVKNPERKMIELS